MTTDQDNIWTPTFTATITAIFDAAEADLRALGFGEIERTEMRLSLETRRSTATISMQIDSIFDETRRGEFLHGLIVSFSTLYLGDRSQGDPDEFGKHLAEARRNLAIVDLADRWQQRWGGMRWTEDGVYDQEKREARHQAYVREREIERAKASLTARRRDVLVMIRDGVAINSASRKIAKSMPELVVDGVLTELGATIAADL
jgi:hypothetical protein